MTLEFLKIIPLRIFNRFWLKQMNIQLMILISWWENLFKNMVREIIALRGRKVEFKNCFFVKSKTKMGRRKNSNVNIQGTCIFFFTYNIEKTDNIQPFKVKCMYVPVHVKPKTAQRRVFFVFVQEKTVKFNISLLLFQDICPLSNCNPFIPCIFVLQVSHPLQQSLLKSMINRKVQVNMNYKFKKIMPMHVLELNVNNQRCVVRSGKKKREIILKKIHFV